jgi:GNAT superfamily N-acetyltransferase
MRNLRISTDPTTFDLALIHRYLSEESYWARGIPRATVDRAIANSLCFAGFLGDRQVAFARMVTDRATFAYLADVFVLPEFRGAGYGKQIVAAVLAHPELQGLRRVMLATRDAHGLYAGFGFGAPTMPETLMEKRDPDIYLRAAATAVPLGAPAP